MRPPKRRWPRPCSRYRCPPPCGLPWEPPRPAWRPRVLPPWGQRRPWGYRVWPREQRPPGAGVWPQPAKPPSPPLRQVWRQRRRDAEAGRFAWSLSADPQEVWPFRESPVPRARARLPVRRAEQAWERRELPESLAREVSVRRVPRARQAWAEEPAAWFLFSVPAEWAREAPEVWAQARAGRFPFLRPGAEEWAKEVSTQAPRQAQGV